MATRHEIIATKVTVEKISGSICDWTEVITRSPYAADPMAPGMLAQSLASSEVAYVGKYDGKIACILGLIPPTLLSESATLWLLHTNLVTEHQFLFVRYSQLVVERLLKKYPVIIGTTSRENKSAIRWIKWLGGEYVGVERHGLLSFIIRKNK